MPSSIDSTIGPRYSLRWMFLIVSLIAVCLFTAKNSDWIAGVGLALGFAFLFAWRHFHDSYAVTGLMLVLGLVVIWFSSVDRVCEIHRCEFCDIHHYEFHYRLLGVSLWSTKHDEHGGTLNDIATYLGRPCSHSYTSLRLVRRWGLIYGARPAMGITCCLHSDSTRVTSIKENLRSLGTLHPEKIDEFHAWLQLGIERDYDVLTTLIQEATEHEPQADLIPD